MSDPSKDTKPTTGKPMLAKQITFSTPTDVPGKNMASGIKAEGQANKKQYRLEYLPWLRYHCITLVVAGKDDEVKYVHESHVKSWDPA